MSNDPMMTAFMVMLAVVIVGLLLWLSLEEFREWRARKGEERKDES